MADVTTTQRAQRIRPTRPTRYSREKADRRLLLCALLIARKQRALCRVVGADPGGFGILSCRTAHHGPGPAAPAPRGARRGR